MNDWKETTWDLELLIKLKREGKISSKINFDKLLKKAQHNNRKKITEGNIEELESRISDWKEYYKHDIKRLKEHKEKLKEL